MIAIAANIYDGHAAERVLKEWFSMVKTLKKIGRMAVITVKNLSGGLKSQFGCILKVVKKKKGSGFQVLPSAMGRRKNLCLAQSISPIK